MGQEIIQRKRNELKKDISKTYNEYKEFEGQKYTGRRLGEATSGIMIKANGKKKR
jgi:hypothetical protein